MKFVVQKMAGYAPRSVRNRLPSVTVAVVGIAALVICGVAAAQALYKYRGENGEWIYSDRPPDDGQEVVEVRSLTPSTPKSGIKVRYEMDGTDVQLVASNEFFAPVELVLDFVTIRGVEFPNPDDRLRWVVPARSELVLVSLGMLDDAVSPFIEYRYQFMVGDPTAQHSPAKPYRVPFAIAVDHPVSQAFPDAVTHRTPDSRHAVDIAMPVGTDIFAARSGTVFDVSAKNFKGGTDAVRDMSLANVVRILHADGTYAVYAHLNLNSIRVRVGDYVERGEYIAESGNTGYSSGPHLHFVIVRNVGLAMKSVPVEFEGADSRPVAPATGQLLTAY